MAILQPFDAEVAAVSCSDCVGEFPLAILYQFIWEGAGFMATVMILGPNSPDERFHVGKKNWC